MSEAENSVFAEHAQVCRQCRLLLDLAKNGVQGADASSAEALTQSILAATSGSTCALARERLCDRVDGLLAPADERIVEIHVEHCESCRQLLRTIVELGRELPQMAELPLSDELVDKIIAATRPVTTMPSGWLQELPRLWRSLLQRPRFSWEAAYVTCLLLLGLLRVASAPLSQAAAYMTGAYVAKSDRAVLLVRAVYDDVRTYVAAAERRGAILGALPLKLKAEIHSYYTLARDRGSDYRQGAASQWAKFSTDLGGVISKAEEELQQLRNRAGGAEDPPR
jgi:hypothetical protein